MSSASKQVSLSAHFSKNKCARPCTTPNTTSSTGDSSEDSGRNRRLIKAKFSSINMKQLERALRRLQESGVATNENGLIKLRHLEEAFQHTQEEEQPTRERRSMRIKLRGHKTAENSEDDRRVNKSPQRKSLDKNQSVVGEPDITSKLYRKLVHSDRRCRKSSSPSNSSKKKEMGDFYPHCDEPTNFSCASPQSQLDSDLKPRMRKGSFLIESLKREYPGQTPTSGVARLVGAREHNIFFPDTSTLYSNEDAFSKLYRSP